MSVSNDGFFSIQRGIVWHKLSELFFGFWFPVDKLLAVERNAKHCSEDVPLNEQ